MLDAMDELAGGAKTSRPTLDAGNLSGTGLFPYPSDAELFSGLALRRRAAGKPWDPESVWQLINDAFNTFREKRELVPSDAKLFGSVKSIPEFLGLVKAAMARVQPGGGNKELTIGRGSGHNGDGGENALYDAAKGAGDSWYKSDGSLNLPPNNGAVKGTEKIVDLKPGSKLGRFGTYRKTSDFVCAPGSDPETLSLPPYIDTSIYQEFTVLKPMPGVTQSTVAPWVGSVGGGTQFNLPMTIEELIRQGYLRK